MVGPIGSPPPGSGPPRDTGQTKAGPDTIAKNDEGVQATYASKLTGRKNHRVKLNVVDIFLERRDNSINFNLSKEELAKLLFKKMTIDPKFCVKVDTCGFGKIQVELTANVKPESMINLPAFDIRDGLRTKFYRPHHRKDTLVTINWLDIETPDSLVTHILGHFGKIKSNVLWSKIKQEENESPLAKLLNNILSGERQIWMEIERPLPSYAIFDGRKVKIYHPGQRRTCARCQKTADHCPGNSNAKLCDENGGIKTKVESVWKDTLKDVGYTDWPGGKEIELVEETEAASDAKENAIDICKEFPNCDGLVLSNLPDDIADEDIKKILESKVLNSSDGISIHPSGTLRSRLIKDISINMISEIVRKVDNKTIDGRIIHCRPHVPSTPSKEEVPKVDEKSNGDNEPESNVEKVSKIPDIVVQKIPGLLEEDRKKALKSAEKKKKAAANRAKKELNKKVKAKKKKDVKEKSQEVDKKKQYKREEFLLVEHDKKTSTENDIEDQFNWTDYSSDENEVFEDSKEEPYEEDFLTPIPYASVFGRKQAALSASSPILPSKQAALSASSPILPSKPHVKRSASSPSDNQNPKKLKNKSLLPLLRKK